MSPENSRAGSRKIPGNAGARHALKAPGISNETARQMLDAMMHPDTFSEIHIGTTDSIYSPTLPEKPQMDVERFYILREDGFFSTEHCFIDRDGSSQQDISRILRLPTEERSRTTIELRGLYSLLDISSMDEIRQLYEPSNREDARLKVLRKLANSYGIEGEINQIEKEFTRYGKIADNIINGFSSNQLELEESKLELFNDVSNMNDPLGLILISLDNRYKRRIRFEAKRKFELMKQVASVDLRDRQSSIPQAETALTQFLSQEVFSSSDESYGEATNDIILYTFDPETNGVIKVDIFNEQNHKIITDRDTGKKSIVRYLGNDDQVRPTYEKVTEIGEFQFEKSVPRRTFGPRKKKVHYKDIGKSIEGKVGKTLIKGHENPYTAVEDDVRALFVLDSYANIFDLINHIEGVVEANGSHMMITDYEDTYKFRREKGNYEERDDPNKKKKRPEMIKFHAQFKVPGHKFPVRAEFIFHTNASNIDYMYKNETGHWEYDANKFFTEDETIGLADLLFPYCIYGIDMNLARIERTHYLRNTISEQLKQSREPKI